ncbi:MAG: hypothetical protein ACQKBV_05225 [Puniceicoccales bacterium]
MPAGIVIYTGNILPLFDFYMNALSFSECDRDEGYALLQHGDCELVLMETEIARLAGASTQPPTPREAVAIKPVFFLDVTLESLRAGIIQFGGHLQEPKSWQFDGRTVCDGYDCDGNVFQLRTKG